MRNHKKRSHSDFLADQSQAGDNGRGFGLAGTVSLLKDEAVASSTTKLDENDSKTESSNGDWQMVHRKSKKSKKDSSAEKDSYPKITHSPQARLQKHVRLSDLQTLILYLLAEGPSPQWVSVHHHNAIRKVVVVMVPGLEREMFHGSMLDNKIDTSKQAEESDPPHSLEPSMDKPVSPDDYYPQRLIKDDLPKPLQPMADIFQHLWPVKTPGDDRLKRMFSPLQAILTTPLPKHEDEKHTKGAQPPREGRNWQDNPTAITEFVAHADQLRDFEYALHPILLGSVIEKETEAERRLKCNQNVQDGWVDTIISSIEECAVPSGTLAKGSMLANKTIVAIDCEMCMTDDETFELTRVSLVGWDGNILMDELVKPDKPITNYLTPYSGITKEKLDPITTKLKDIQTRLLDILTPQTVLIGHSLNSDLNALKMTHHSIVDTSMIYPHPRGPPLKTSLKWLAQKYLSQDIQVGNNGHNSIEDARAALNLVKLKCQRGPTWGTPDASGESIFKRISRSPKPQTMKDSPNKCTGAVVDWGSPERGYGGSADVCIGCSNDADVVNGIKKVITGDEDGKDIPGGGVEFVWARMRELEAVTGWWTSSKTADNDLLRVAATKTDAVDEDHPISTTNGAHSKESTLTPASALVDAVGRSIAHIKEIYDNLPPCTAFIVYSGSGDPRELSRYSALQQQFKKEYAVKKWDELSVRWTEREDRGMRDACQAARRGIGFVTVK